jgi:hypothetical protein
MPVIRALCSFAADGGLPRDRFVITPHFAVANPIPEYGGLANDLVTALSAWTTANGRAAGDIEVRLYDAEAPPGAPGGPPPNFPVHVARTATRIAPDSTAPRELAVCLSFYAERNLPRTRGRLYIPVPLLMGSGSTDSIRPPSVFQERASNLVPVLTGLGGVDVDWVVWSREDRQARAVTHWFVDNEWDVQRKRGLRPTGRLTGATTEAQAP